MSLNIRYSKQAKKFISKQDKLQRDRPKSAVNNLPLKERILGAVTVMNNEDAEKIWNIIVNMLFYNNRNIYTDIPVIKLEYLYKYSGCKNMVFTISILFIEYPVH